VTGDDFTGADLTDAQRLETAVMVAIGELVAVVGLPQPDGAMTPRVTATNEPLVHLDRVPAEAFRAACEAILHLGTALAHCQPEDLPAVSVEDGLAAMARPAPTAGWAP
jgi:hypothetical protein